MGGLFSSADLKRSGGEIVGELPKCGRCGLYKNCQSPKMETGGDGKLPILFVGDAPGATDDARGEQFMGVAGQIIQTLLGDVGVGLDKCWKTNSIICHPDDGVMSPVHLDCCRPNLINTIAKLQPKVIVPLGMSAVKSLIGPEWEKDIGSVNRWVGWQIPSARHKAWICPTYHPSFVLYKKNDPALEKIMSQHLHNACTLCQTKPDPFDVQGMVDKIEIIRKPANMILRMHELAGKSGVLAFDYETTGIKPESTKQKIKAASFCLDGCDTFSGVISPECFPALSRVLQNERLLKIGSNIKFEERWTIQKLGHGVAGWHWDTMLAAHILDNRAGITSIKFQAYVLLGVGDYSSDLQQYLVGRRGEDLNHIDSAHLGDMLKYCAFDSLIEYKVAQIQMAKLQRRKVDADTE